MTAKEYVMHYASGQGGFESVSVDVALKAIEYAKQEAKQQMIKDAVEATVTDIRTYKDENEVDFSVIYEKGLIPYEIEQEVKLLVLKEE